MCVNLDYVSRETPFWLQVTVGTRTQVARA